MLKNKKLTVILPVYNEEEGLFSNVLKINEVLIMLEIPHSFVLVDDGSKDETWKEIIKLSQKIELKAVRFSRNFGKEVAIMAALEHVDADGCVILDSDLQHPPSIIGDMYKKWIEEGFEIVEGVKAQRGKERIINKVGAIIFYKIFSKLSGFNIRNLSDFKLLDIKVVRALLRLPERQIFFRGVSAWVGFKKTQIEFKVQDRHDGKSNWSLWSLYKLALLAITSFSSIPLHIVTFMGVLFLFGSFILGIQTLYMKFSGYAVSGFTTVILLILIIGSTLMISLGIIGVYIEKIFNEIKCRPRHIITETIDSKELV
jgi:dolichol-phosphate mannosyltransferase